MALEGFGLDWCCGLAEGWLCGIGMRRGGGGFLGRFSLISVAGNMLVAVGACILGMVIRWEFLDFLDFFYFLEWMEEVVVWVWWRWREVWG